MRPVLAVIGNISHDSAEYGNKQTVHFWGGSGLNISLSAASSSIRPRLISVVGTDAADLVKRVTSLIDVSKVLMINGETSRFHFRYGHTGRIKDITCNYGVSVKLPEHLRDLNFLPAHYHVSCRKPIDPKGILPVLLEKGFSFSLDFIITSVLEEAQAAFDWIPSAKYVFVNREELRQLRNVLNIERLKFLIVTSGMEPVEVYEFGRLIFTVNVPRCEYQDVTAAGDVFIGTFLAEAISGQSLVTSVESGIAAAQKSLGGLGAWNVITDDIN